MNTKILTALMLIGIVSVAAGAGTYAYFSDTESSTGNTFTAGTLDLKLSDDNEFAQDGVSGTWTMNNMAPGDSVTAGLTLSNPGSITGDHVEFSFSNSMSDPAYQSGNNEESDTLDGAAGMDEYMEVTSMSYNGVTFDLTPATGDFSDTNGNGWIDLDDLEDSANAGALDDLDSPNGGTNPLSMEITFNSNAPNDYQGDIVDTTVTATLNQDSSQ